MPAVVPAHSPPLRSSTICATCIPLPRVICRKRSPSSQLRPTFHGSRPNGSGALAYANRKHHVARQPVTGGVGPDMPVLVPVEPPAHGSDPERAVARFEHRIGVRVGDPLRRADLPDGPRPQV